MVLLILWKWDSDMHNIYTKKKQQKDPLAHATQFFDDELDEDDQDIFLLSGKHAGKNHMTLSKQFQKDSIMIGQNELSM